MRVGRPGKGVDYVKELDGSRHAKERLCAILRVVGGELSRKEGAARLGISERRYRELRDRALSSALESLEPRPPGRPRKHRDAQASSAESKQQELRDELEVALLREEIALLMPELVRRERGPGRPRRRVAGKRRGSRESGRG